MKFMIQLIIILLFSFTGDWLSTSFSLPIPGSILGLILLFTALQTGLLKLHWVDQAGNWLKNNIAFFFVPVTVSIMTYFDVLKANLFELTLILIVSTIVTYLVSAWIVQLVVKKENVHE